MGFSVVIQGMDGVTEMEDDTPGVTAWPKFIATCTRVTRKQRVVACREESRTNTKLFHPDTVFVG
jgi:hypothetical protein